MNPFRPTFVHIHLDRLSSNYQRLKTLTQSQKFLCPMIKANGYGHGDVEVAKTLVKDGCSFFGVSSVEEGLRLREHHVDSNVLVFGFSGEEAVQELLAQKLTPVVSDFEQLESLSKLTTESTKIHLKFNTGMNRLGFDLKDSQRLMDQLSLHKQFIVQGLCTHLHSGENIGSSVGSSQQQLNAFQKVRSFFRLPIEFHHAYNSAAMTGLYQQGRSFEFGARPGLLAYGIDPAENLSLKPLVSPVMEYKSKIVSIHEVKSGEVVSYGGTWKASQDSLIGIVPAGYADGVSTALSNRGEVLVCGKRVPISGRVCMDYTMVDLTGVKQTSSSLLNEDVVFIGQQGDEAISVEDVAKVSGQITYEVMTGISERVPRYYGVNP